MNITTANTVHLLGHLMEEAINFQLVPPVCLLLWHHAIQTHPWRFCITTPNPS